MTALDSIPHLWDMEKDEKEEGSSLPSWCGSVCSAAEVFRVELGAAGCCCCCVPGFEPPAPTPATAAAAEMLRLLLASLTPLVLSVLARAEEAARVLRLDLGNMVSLERKH